MIVFHTQKKAMGLVKRVNDIKMVLFFSVKWQFFKTDGFCSLFP